MSYEIISGVVEIDFECRNGWATKYWMEIRESNRYVEEDFKEELVLDTSPLGQPGYRYTKPSPVVVERHEWTDADEYSGRFKPLEIKTPYLEANKKGERLAQEAKKEEKAAALDQRASEVEESPELMALIQEAITQDPKAVEEYRSGKEKALNALVGKVMGASKKKGMAVQAFDVTYLMKKRLAA